MNLFSQWQAIGGTCVASGNGSSNDVKLAFRDNLPIMVYRDGLSEQKATARQFNGTNWTNLGNQGFTEGAANYLSLIVHFNIPYIAFQDGANSNKVTVMKFDGTNWITIGTAGFSSGEANFISIQVIEETPYVAYQDVSNGNKATVMTFDGANWLNVGSPGFSAGAANFIDMKIIENSPYVVFQDAANSNRATVMKFEEDNWVVIGNPGFSSGSVFSTVIASQDMIPYVAFTDVENGSKATVMRFAEEVWSNVGNAGLSFGQIDNPQLTIQNGVPYIAYRDLSNCGLSGGRGTVKRFDGTSWLDVGDACFTHTSVNVQAFMRTIMFHNNELYVAFTDAGCGANTKSTVMKYQCNSVTELTEISCDSFIFNNQTLTSSGLYSFNFSNSEGCDSIINLDLTINYNSTGVVFMDENVLKSSQDSAIYQWLDCDNNYAAIEGETNQVFEVSVTGRYAVSVETNSCIDTSFCFNVTVSSTNHLQNNNFAQLYPNPAEDFVNIELLDNSTLPYTVSFFNLSGQLIHSKNIFQQQQTLQLDLAKGIFIVSIENRKEKFFSKLVIH